MSDAEAARSLLSAGAVRKRAHEMLAAGLKAKLSHLTVDLTRLPACADFVATVIRKNYPSLDVPFHARWRHFVVGGRDLWAERAAATRWPDAAKARAEFDLAIVSVLLDAGAGMGWHYHDAATGAEIGRSEGLALASLRMFEAGTFSSDPRDPLRADAGRLAKLTADDIARGFQVTGDNPLVGLEGRAALLARLGAAVAASPTVFGMADTPRPGGLYDLLAGEANGSVLPAPRILAALLDHLGAIWPGRLTLGGVSLGDTWRHPAIRRADVTDGLIPFHKLSQWLSYSLIEPLQWSGIEVTDIDGLTGLAEYRNGGLFVDSGVLTLRDPAQLTCAHDAGSELVVEWRALTVALLDGLAATMRKRLNMDAVTLPLAKVLEGGTWAAGRAIAREKRPDGTPPLNVTSDGTVF